MKTQTRHSLMLMLCAFIWGTAFVAQSAGSGMGAYSFLAGRSWLAVLVLIPTVFAFDAVRKKQGQPYGWHFSVYTTPEALWGYDHGSTAYSVAPAESKALTADQIWRNFPEATQEELDAVLG